MLAVRSTPVCRQSLPPCATPRIRKLRHHKHADMSRHPHISVSDRAISGGKARHLGAGKGVNESFLWCPKARGKLHRVMVQSEDQEANRAPHKHVGWNETVKWLAVTVGVALASAASALYIDQFSQPPCTVLGQCEPIGPGIKVVLVATHLYSFMLLPATMYVFYTKLGSLRDKGARSPFTALTGLGYIMVAIASEIGWHVTQGWFYKEEYAILNLTFYEFLVLGLSMWAYGIRLDPLVQDSVFAQLEQGALFSPTFKNPPAFGASMTRWGAVTDWFLISAPILTGAFYLLGAAYIHSKVPIYLLMLVIFIILTRRFYNLLGTRWVLLFPIFSVGVNLSFIAVLNKYQEDNFLNPLFHILHDAAGTELGIAIIAILVYLGLPSTDVRMEESMLLVTEPPTSSSAESAPKWSTVHLPREDSTEPIQIAVLKNKSSTYNGVVLFMHGYQQLPWDYDSLLGDLAISGLLIVAPLQPSGIYEPKPLQEAIVKDLRVVTKALFSGDGRLPPVRLDGIVAIVGHSLGGGLSPQVVLENPNRFTHMALMSPMVDLQAYKPQDAITNQNFHRPHEVLVITASLDYLARASSIKKGIEQALLPPADETYNFPFGNHTGYCDSAHFFEYEFFNVLVATSEVGNVKSGEVGRLGALVDPTTPPKLSKEATFAVMLGVLALLGGGSAYGLVHSTSWCQRGVCWVLLVLSVLLIFMECFWVLYYGPDVQKPQTKALLRDFILPP